VQWQSLSWSLFVILIQRYNLTILVGIWNASTLNEWMWVSLMEFGPIQVLWVRSDPIRSDPIRSDPIRSGPIQVLSTAQLNNVFTFGSKKLSIFLLACTQAYNFCKHFRSVQWWPVHQCLEFYLCCSIKNTGTHIWPANGFQNRNPKYFPYKNVKREKIIQVHVITCFNCVICPRVKIMFQKMSQYQQNNFAWHMRHTTSKK